MGETTPAKIGHYTIVSELGRGGMGVVYKAHEESLNRFVAIKVLGAHLAEDPTFVARFMREARAAAALSHPNIIQIFFIGEDEGRHYFVMEYVSGKSLLAMVREEGRIDNPRASQFMLQAANGLAAAHDANLLHRDIKPANLMVDERGLLKIADFGLALPQDAATRLTATGMLMGTPGYLSPEQCRGEAVDRRTDIYSLGVTFFELLSGRTPFHADSPLALLRLILEQEPPDIASLSGTVDPETSRIVHKMIAKDPAQRYQDCHELAADLERWLAGSGARLAPGAVAGIVGAAQASAPTAGNEEPTTRLPGPNDTPGAAAVVAAVAGAPSAPPAAVSAPGADPSPAVAPPPPATVPANVAPSALAPAPQAAVAPVAAAPATRRSRAPLVALAIIVVLLAAMGASAYFLLHSPLVRRYVPWLSRAGAAAVARGATSAAAEPPSPATGEPAPAPESAAAPAAESQVPPAAVAASAPPATAEPPSAAGIPPGEASVSGGTGPAVGRRARHGGSASAGAATETNAGSQPAPPVEREVAPAPARAVVVGRVAVAVIGEQPLAGAVADLLQSELSARGLQPIDAASLPGGDDLLRGRGAPTAGELIRALAASDAAELVVARIQPAGERTLSYMGRHDVAYSSRVTLSCFDLTTGQPKGPSPGATVEYTSIGAAGAAEKALGAAVTEIGRQAR